MYTLNLSNGTETKTVSFADPKQGDGAGATVMKGMMARRMRPGLGRGVMRASQLRGVAQGSQSRSSFQNAQKQVSQLVAAGYKAVTEQDKQLLQKFFNIV